MCGLSCCYDLQLHTPLVPAIDIHLGWFADHYKIGFDARIHFNESIRRNAITPFFHVPEIP